MTLTSALPIQEFKRLDAVETPWGPGHWLARGCVLSPPSVSVKGSRRDLYGTSRSQIHSLTDTSKLAMLEAEAPLNVGLIFPKSLQSIGTDPEIFAFGPSGALIPAFKYLPSKSNAGGGDKIFWDGYQGELSLSSPYTCIEQMTDGVQECLKRIHSQLLAHNPSAHLQPFDVVEVSRKSLSEEVEEFVALGCSPSLNAYGIEPISVPDSRDLPLRFSGCHSHHALKDWSQCVFAEDRASDATYRIPLPSWFPNGTVVMMDKIAGLCLTALGRGLEDPRRRRYYGRPGEYRLPQHKGYYLGVEYRTPGAFVLGMPELVHFSTNLCRHAYNMGLMFDGRSFPVEDVKDIIMNCDADGAWEVISKNASLFERIFASVWSCNPAKVFKLLKEGIAPSGYHNSSMTDAWDLRASVEWRGGAGRTFGKLLQKVTV